MASWNFPSINKVFAVAFWVFDSSTNFYRVLALRAYHTSQEANKQLTASSSGENLTISCAGLTASSLFCLESRGLRWNFSVRRVEVDILFSWVTQTKTLDATREAWARESPTPHFGPHNCSTSPQPNDDLERPTTTNMKNQPNFWIRHDHYQCFFLARLSSRRPLR